MPWAPKTRGRKRKRRDTSGGHKYNSWQRGYNTRWQRESTTFLREKLIESPWCRICKREPASLTDHIIPPSTAGEPTDERYQALFWDQTNWQPACKRCNDRKGNKLPMTVWVVTGPPGCGKTTYVAKNKGEHDLVFDLDVLGGAVGGFGAWPRPDDVLDLLMDWRRVLIERIKTREVRRTAWVIVTDEQQAMEIASECRGQLVRPERA